MVQEERRYKLPPEVILGLAGNLASEQDLEQMLGLIEMLGPVVVGSDYPAEVRVQVAGALGRQIDHTDEKVRRAVANVGEQIWDKVGIWHELVPPTGDYEGSYLEHGKFSSFWGWEDRVAMLALAQAKARGQARTVSDLEADVFRYLGVKTSVGETIYKGTDPVLERLAKLRVKTADGKYEPVVEVSQGGEATLQLGDVTFEKMAPYREVLEAICLVREPLADEDLMRWREVRSAVDESRMTATNLWQGEYKQLLLPRTVGGFEETVLAIMDDFFDLVPTRAPRIRVGTEDMVAVAVEGRMVQWVRDTGGGLIVRTGGMPLESSDGRLVRNFMGELISGKVTGSLGVVDGKLVAMGEYLPQALPEDLRASVDLLTLSSDRLTLRWLDVSGEANKHVMVAALYSRPHNGDYFQPDVRRIRHGLVDQHLYGVEVLMGEKAGEAIDINQKEGTVKIVSGEEQCIVDWHRFKGYVRFKIKGETWEQTLKVPYIIEPVPVAQEMRAQFVAAHNWVMDQRDEVVSSRNHMRRFRLGDEYRWMMLARDINEGKVDSSDREQVYAALEGYKSQVPKDIKHIDLQLQQLTTQQQWLVRLYIFSKAGERNKSPLDSRMDLTQLVRTFIEATPGIPHTLINLIDRMIPQGSMPEMLAGQMEERMEFYQAVIGWLKNSSEYVRPEDFRNVGNILENIFKQSGLT